MNGRKLFREFAQSKGYEAVEFVEIIPGRFDELDTLVTKNSNGQAEHSSLNYRDMVHWIIKTKKNPN